jgi:hypothetical protein
MTIVKLIVAAYLLAALFVWWAEWSEQRAADNSHGRKP